jgi:hypothetical protein
MFTLDDLVAVMQECKVEDAIIEKVKASLMATPKYQSSYKNAPDFPFGKHQGLNIYDVCEQVSAKEAISYAWYVLSAKDQENPNTLWIKEKFPELYESCKVFLEELKEPLRRPYKKRKKEEVSEE